MANAADTLSTGSKSKIAKSRTASKTTYIYGLIDPRTHQCRYVGKTVLTPNRRLHVHKWRSKAEGHKGHSMAWIASLCRDGSEPEVITLEEVAPGGDWVEAEQFWIEYLRWLGAELCNHSIGGEGQTGFKQTPEMIARRIRRGAQHHSTGKKKPPHVIEALSLGTARMRGDPIRRQSAYEKQIAGFKRHGMVSSIAGLKRAHADPLIHATAVAKQTERARTTERRQLASEQSSARWAESRDYIIARQNEGKGDEWKRKQSEDPEKRKWAVPGNKMALAMARRTKDFGRRYRGNISHGFRRNYSNGGWS
jgi:hypothetical protein